jgi:hypothetical protein
MYKQSGWRLSEERSGIRSARKVKNLSAVVEEQRGKLKLVKDDRITERITDDSLSKR